MNFKVVLRAILPIVLLFATFTMAAADEKALEPMVIELAPKVAIPDGFATGTTGGGDAKPVTVTTAEEFSKLIAGDEPQVIVVKGRIDTGGRVSIGSNKTIIGADYSSGIYGGTINVEGKNYIFQNLIIGPAYGITMEVSDGSNIFVHKCDFIDSLDESISIVRDSDFVTVSWCKFYFTKPYRQAFGQLIGRTVDSGKLNVTMHHNWYCEGITGRAPRVRHGHVHIYNNYYNIPDNSYCIGVGQESKIRLENSIFENIKQPWQYMDQDTEDMDQNMDQAGSGTMGWSGLMFVNSSEPTEVPNAFATIFTPLYEYKADAVEDVVKLVTDPVYGAGNRHTRPAVK